MFGNKPETLLTWVVMITVIPDGIIFSPEGRSEERRVGKECRL